MAVGHAIFRVATAKISDNRHDGVEVIETLHNRGQCLDQFLALLVEVRRLEQWPRGGIALEQPIVELPRRQLALPIRAG
jgi:hypothetical protein